jgi:uncharacterized protein (TIGR00106 family)
LLGRLLETSWERFHFRWMKEDTLVEFSITPLGVGESVSKYVARCTERIQKSGLPNELHAMGTIVEGSLDECFDLIKGCIRDVLKDSPRVTAAVKVDVRPGKTGRIRAKVEAVEKLIRKK